MRQAVTSLTNVARVALMIRASAATNAELVDCRRAPTNANGSYTQLRNRRNICKRNWIDWQSLQHTTRSVHFEEAKTTKTLPEMQRRVELEGKL